MTRARRAVAVSVSRWVQYARRFGMLAAIAIPLACDERRPHVRGRSVQEWIVAVRDSNVPRTDAIAAIAQLTSESPAAAAVLEGALDAADPAVRLLVVEAIGRAGAGAQFVAMRRLESVLLRDPVDLVRARAAWALGRISSGERDAVASLAVALRDSVPAVRAAAARALAAVGAPARQAITALMGLRYDTDSTVRHAGREAFAALRITQP